MNPGNPIPQNLAAILITAMSEKPFKTSKRVLEPNERIAEVLFGLIMVLTYTGSLSVAQANRARSPHDAHWRAGLQPGLGHH